MTEVYDWSNFVLRSLKIKFYHFRNQGVFEGFRSKKNFGSIPMLELHLKQLCLSVGETQELLFFKLSSFSVHSTSIILYLKLIEIMLVRKRIDVFMFTRDTLPTPYPLPKF